MKSVEELEIKIKILENENRLLKERPTEAGISYADIVEDHIGDTASNYDPDQGTRIRKFEITDKVANDFL